MLICVGELERSKVVDDRRCRFACGTVVTGLSLWIPLLALFYLFFTPVSVWYSTTHVYDLTSYVETTIAASISAVITNRNNWYDWHQSHLLGMTNTNDTVSSAALLQPYALFDDGISKVSGSQKNVTYLLSENVLLGPMSVIGIRAAPTPCAYPGAYVEESTSSFDLNDLICYTPLETSKYEWTDLVTSGAATTHPTLLDIDGGGHLLPANRGGMKESYDGACSFSVV